MPAENEPKAALPCVSSDALRDELADTLNRVRYGGERILISRYGQPIAALVPVGDIGEASTTEPAKAGAA